MLRRFLSNQAVVIDALQFDDSTETLKQLRQTEGMPVTWSSGRWLIRDAKRSCWVPLVEGDWILQRGDGTFTTMVDEEFRRLFKVNERLEEVK